MPESEPTLNPSAQVDQQVACPSCLRVLQFSGDRPLFCAYCGVPLERTEADGSSTVTVGGAEATTDPDQTGIFIGSDATVEYLSGVSPADGIHGEQFPDWIAGYRLVRKLGSGGMGTVFEAVDEQQGQTVALKLITSGYLSSSEAIQRFRQEGRMASAVTHPRCVFVLAVDDDQGRPYLVMELMPGTTLQSLVEQKGTLDPAAAILKIFDVIEGLEEFHKLGMIHRDVKPSNCFLEAGGRVKIGDFGLSKSVEGGLDLTRTGAFLGTPLYASPEQIKRDPLDQQTDVYSVAATLYFLMTKRPPVQAADAAEALARIVSEPAPLLRTFLPDVPRALEAVIHKGLERDRSRRWRNLREFHNALLPFVPERVNIGAIGLRVGAYLFDLMLFYLSVWAVFAVGLLYFRGRVFETVDFFERYARAIQWADVAIWVFYFAITEGLFGASLGKWLAGLRVARVGSGEPPGMGRGIVRIIAFALMMGPGANILIDLFNSESRATDLWYWGGLLLIKVVGVLAIVSTMRQRSGFRGPHEWLSGTRVVQVIGGRRLRPFSRSGRLAARKIRHAESTPIADAVTKVGPYEVQGAVSQAGQGRVLLGQDSSLDRRVWILLRPPTAEPPSASRRALNRLARPRWIGGGDQSEWRWDAFTAPSGHSLPEIVESGGLPWCDVLPLLTDLAEELEAARSDGTFPRRLSVDHVWVQNDGRVQILDPLAWDDVSPRDEQPVGLEVGRDEAVEESRALAFLRDVARLSLEGDRAHRRPSLVGRPRHDDAASLNGAAQANGGIPQSRIRAAVPERARVLLERLTGHRAPYTRLSNLRADLVAAAGRPAEVSAMRRTIQLMIQAFLLSPAMLLLVGLTCPKIRPGLIPWDLQIVTAVPLCWVLWAILMRGGVSYPLSGLVLVRNDGRAASRLQCGVRALLAWAPAAVFLVGSRYLQHQSPQSVMPAWSLWMAGVLVLLVFTVIAILFPSRGPHDRLSGTVVVPI